MARVGLLEDNSKIAKLCATMLNYAGHEVTIYERPSECLDALSVAGISNDGLQPLRESIIGVALPVEVLILDLNLPEIGGIEVLRRLQSNPHTRALPLIFCTATSGHELEYAFRIAPRASLVEKPFKLQTLISAISTALKAS